MPDDRLLIAGVNRTGALREWAQMGACLLALAAGCAEYDAGNPFDPYVNGGRDPFGLLAIADTAGVRLSWNRVAVNGVDKYVLYRATGDSSGFQVLAEVSEIDSTSYRNTGLSPDTVYFYQVRLVARGGESNPSAIAWARPIAARTARLSVTYLGVPPDTLDYDTGQSAFALTVADSGNADLVIESVVTSHVWITHSVIADTIPAGGSAVLVVGIVRDSLAPRDEPYAGTITITTNGGSVTLAVLALVPDRAPPRPSLLRITAIGPHDISLAWSPCGDADFARYLLVRSVDSTVNRGDPTAHAGTAADDTAFTDSGLAPLAAYWYRVYTIDADSLVDSSNAVGATTTAARVLNGTVSDAELSAAIDGVSVRIIGDDTTCVSGTDGTYRILNPDSGLAVVEFSKGGYLARGDTVRIPATGPAQLDASLIPWPFVRQITQAQEYSDLYDICADNQHVYTVDRDVAAPKAVVRSISSGNVVAVHDLSGSVNSPPARILLVNGRLFITCPADKKILRIAQPLTGGSAIGGISVSFEPYGICARDSTIYVSGVYDSTTGSVNVFDTDLMPGPFYPVYNVYPSYATTATIGPEICVAGAYAYVTNGSVTQGNVARVELAGSGATMVVPTDLPYLSDIVSFGGRVYVSCSDGAADSVLAFTAALERVRGIYTGCPGSSLAYCRAGFFAGQFAMTSSGPLYGTTVHFLSEQLHVSAGAVNCGGYELSACAFTPDGMKLMVAGTGQMAVLTQ